MDRSFAERINCIKVMLAGLLVEDALLSRHGLTREFIEEMLALYNKVMLMDSNHQALKSQLKMMTSAKTNEMETLEAKFRFAKKIVKLLKPQESWLGYGFPDER